MKTNRVMLADSYKYSHSEQYPKNTVKMFDYMEARSNKVYHETVFFGLQAMLKEYFSTPITMDEVLQAKSYADMHGVPFDLKGWVYIVQELGGNLPVEIRAVPEGTVVPNKNVLVTIESTDKNVPWIVGWMETVLMKVWYPCTVATKSYNVRKMIQKYYDLAGATTWVDFQYHNFGDRGSSSVETAAIGGAAHLTQFMGTDNFNSLMYINEYYGVEGNCAGFSIAASEHSTVTSRGREGEFEFYNEYLEINKGRSLVACVMDSYDIFKAVDYITSGDFKEKVESDEYPTWVIRPDSGEPITVLREIIEIMISNGVKYTKNERGYILFDKYRLIWGDGITPETMEEILKYMLSHGYSPENIAFGSGGDLMQNVTRDTLGFAVKCSSITLDDGTMRDVYKDPITDSGKVSKKGEMTLVKQGNDYVTMRTNNMDSLDLQDEILETVYVNGQLVKEYTFDEIRKNSRS